MIPFIHIPPVEIGPLTIHPFGILVGTAVLVGTKLATWRAARLGLDLDKLRSFTTWMLVGGFVGGHVIDAALYRPEEIVRRPWMLLEIWSGQGSYGGFLGALLAVVLWKYVEAADEPWFFGLPRLRLRERAEPILPFADLVLSVFPVAWIFGRAGCAVAHDHPGVVADPGAFFAVAYGPWDPAAVIHGPFGIELRNGSLPRYDLGTLELFATIAIAAFFALTWKRKLPAGFYLAAVAIAYAPVRFALDFLRVRGTPSADARYGTLTPAQWCCIALFGFGVFMALQVRDRAHATPPPPPAATGSSACRPWRRHRARHQLLSKCSARQSAACSTRSGRS